VKRILALMFALALVVSCAKKGEENKTAAAGGSYLIKINETALTKEDIEKELQGMPEEIRQAFLSDKAQLERFLEDYATKEMLHKEAVKKGIDKDKDFTKKIEYFKKITAIQMMLEKELAKKAEVTDKDIQEYYKKNKEQFKRPASYRMSHILVKTEAEAKKAEERVRKGEDFAKVAKEVSADKESAKNGGDIGELEKGNMPPEFDKAVQKMKKGDISAPVKTQFGYHIIKVADVKPESYMEVTNVKENLRNVLAQEKQKEVFDAYLRDLKKSYKLDINKAEVEKFVASKNPQKDNKKDTKKESSESKPADAKK
jgi:peptidyl-prolyl cis-trans isomerase C